MQSVYRVDGKPFFPLGGQSCNSSAYNEKELETFWRALKEIGGNTAEIPVYWETVEPEEGRFDFTSVDRLISKAEENGVRLILLWFATWKNGTMRFTPPWVKKDTGRFKRVITHDGIPISVLSSHCKANFEADCRAFCALMEHVRQADGRKGTVIGIQVENEPGITGRSVRDHGPDGEAEFLANVPSALIEKIRENPSSPIHGIWKRCGGKSAGSWPKLFGNEASELFTAWSIAGYIGGIAEAGKRIYDIPMHVNVWISGLGWEMPGLDYPSGGAVAKVLDIWKWTAKSLDIIAPDIYRLDSQNYCRDCSIYNRKDNPLFIPESHSWDPSNARNMFYAIGKYDAIGIMGFGIENIYDGEGAVRPNSRAIADSFRAVSKALPLLVRYHGAGRIHPVVQEEGMLEQQLLFDGFSGLVCFKCERADYHHGYSGTKPQRGGGLVIEADRGEFYVLGGGFTLSLRQHYNVDYAMQLTDRNVSFLSVEEGHFDDCGSFVCDRVRNGDESDYGIWVAPDVGVVKVIMGE